MKTLSQRTLQAVFLLFGVCVLNFFLFHLSPGDPTNLYFGPKVKHATMDALRKQMGWDHPWYQQFGLWFSQILRGNLGFSWSNHRPVADILKEAVPATLQLTGLALLLNVGLGCLVGIVAATRAHRWTGKLMDYAALTLYSLPTFWLGLMLILLFSLKLQWLPASQMRSFYQINPGLWARMLDRVRHLVLPVTVLGLTGAAATFRYVRGHMIDVLQQDYITQARAKGLPRRSVLLRHAFRNALLPVVTLLGMYFPFLLGGALIVEVVFAWPGMGRITYEAIFAKDYPVLMATNLIAATMVIAGNLVADLLYRFIDPRIHLE